MLDSHKHKNFRLKQGVVCKVLRSQADSQNLAIYLPSTLLYPTMVYAYKFYLHPSPNQTALEFSARYFHPQSQKAAKRVCNACLTCAKLRNPEYRLVPVGRKRSVVPTLPREAISMDLLYMPKSSHGRPHPRPHHRRPIQHVPVTVPPLRTDPAQESLPP